MSQTLQTSADRAGEARSAGALAAMTGVAAAVAGAALAFYSAYGDPHAPAGQKAGVPFLAGLVVVVAALVFGLLVPRALRTAAAGGPRAARWGLAHSIVALIATPLAFWSGVPLAVGAAGLLLGVTGRRQAQGRGTATAAAVTGVLAVAGGIIFAVLGDTVLSHH